jgi:hypothetical protein
VLSLNWTWGKSLIHAKLFYRLGDYNEISYSLTCKVFYEAIRLRYVISGELYVLKLYAWKLLCEYLLCIWVTCNASNSLYVWIYDVVLFSTLGK